MPYIYNGKTYRSYKHPILEYILAKALREAEEIGKPAPSEIVFTYSDLNVAIVALGIKEDRASKSNFTLDLLRRQNEWQSRVSMWIWEQGYDLDRIPNRKVRSGEAGRLVLKELKVKTWLEWPEIDLENVSTIQNQVPDDVLPFLGNDEAALLSVMDYCDVLSQVLVKKARTINRVQHPKKWQPGEVDGLYVYSDRNVTILYPVEAKALSTRDSLNLHQVQGAYNTIRSKEAMVRIVPLGVSMTTTGMHIVVFESNSEDQLEPVSYYEVRLDPPIENWQK